MTNADIGPEGSYFEAREREKCRQNERNWDGVYPIVITFAYLVLGFVFHLWHPGWLLFLTIPVYYMKPKNNAERWLNPVSITLIFLALGIFFGLWHPAWMLFLLIPVVEILKKKCGEPAKETDKPQE
jgi:hypothetical protein